MHQTRKHRLFHPHFPVTTARSVTEFMPTSVDQTEPIGVEVVDWGIVIVARITSLTSVPLSIERITVNDDFTPVLVVSDATGAFELLEWPRGLSYGESINAVIQAPLAAARTLDYCYPHPPRAITVSTGSEVLQFRAGQTVLQGEDDNDGA